VRVSILTISDSVAAGKYDDRSGPSVVARCKEFGWDVVSTAVLADERIAIEAFLKKAADAGEGAVDLILTTGGTGVGPRDVTPEATQAAVEKWIPGFAEHIRAEGHKSTERALLSRGLAGIRAKTIIINLPGSPTGAVESLNAIAALLPHAVDVVHGARH
jgi:molybdopterin adenylyltransferase